MSDIDPTGIEPTIAPDTSTIIAETVVPAPEAVVAEMEARHPSVFAPVDYDPRMEGLQEGGTSGQVPVMGTADTCVFGAVTGVPDGGHTNYVLCKKTDMQTNLVSGTDYDWDLVRAVDL